MAKKKEQGVKLDGNATVSSAGKSISISDDSGPVLTVTNEYGNSATYRIEAHSFGGLWAQLWQYVKDSQH
jgi:hypothetical protein